MSRLFKLLWFILLAICFPCISFAVDFTFVAWGDTREGYPNLQTMSPQVLAKNPDFLLFSGDLESSGFTTSGMTTFINAYNGGTGNGLSSKTFFVRGNHDGSNVTGWESYFNFAEVTDVIGAMNYSSHLTDRAYSFDYGNSHFIGLDVPGDISGLGSAQITWLNTDLTAAEGRGIVNSFIFVHGPPYCVNGHCLYSTIFGDTAPKTFWDIVNNHMSVKVLFAGHEHVKTRTLLNNIRIPELTRDVVQIVAGAAGAPAYSCDKPNRYEWCNNAHGYTVVEVTDRVIRFKTYNQNSSDVQDDYIFGESPILIPAAPTNLFVE